MTIAVVVLVIVSLALAWSMGTHYTAAEPGYAIVVTPTVHRAVDVLLLSSAHLRWEFVFQPTYAAYSNLIEP